MYFYVFNIKLVKDFVVKMFPKYSQGLMFIHLNHVTETRSSNYQTNKIFVGMNIRNGIKPKKWEIQC